MKSACLGSNLASAAHMAQGKPLYLSNGDNIVTSLIRYGDPGLTKHGPQIYGSQLDETLVGPLEPKSGAWNSLSGWPFLSLSS